VECKLCTKGVWGSPHKYPRCQEPAPPSCSDIGANQPASSPSSVGFASLPRHSGLITSAAQPARVLLGQALREKSTRLGLRGEMQADPKHSSLT